MVFAKLDFVLNAPALTADRVATYLDELARRPHERELIQMVIHEQYFYPDYCGYLPDYAERLEAGVQWCLAHGYRPGFVEEILREDQPPILGTLC